MRSCTEISTSVRSSPPRASYFCVLPCGASLTGLCAVRAYKDFVLRCTVRAPKAFCAVRAYKGFALLCTVRAPGALRGASLKRLCASVYRTSAKSFARCEPPKAFYRVRAPRALRGASLQRLSTVYERQELCAVRASNGFVPLCAVRASRAFVRCEPTKAFYRVRAPRALRGASLQRLYASVCCKSLTSFCAVRAYKGLLPCTSAKSFARCEPPTALCLCVL